MFEFFSGDKEKIFMEWSDHYCVGSKRLDDDHKGLFDVVNHYYNAVHKGEAQEVLDAILNILDKYMQQHFAFEEELMAEIGFKQFREHQKMHRDLVAAFHATQLSYHMSPDSFDSEAFLTFLQTWLTRHILVEDRKLAPYIENDRNARKKGETV